ncbi:YbgS-like family protein [Klebsiella aerogenes]|uniref:YbgS-like family protein n=1 Tax=Klebsiella aerogenes TaxID=548 RepID=UPI002D7EDD0B|nr:YbgS-like family protein [Klebsiella aerogenes]
MNMNKLTALLLTAILSLASGAALAADSGAQSNNGQANSAADAGQVAPDARENVAPNNVDNDKINSGGTMLHPDGSTMNHDGMSSDEVHKNSMCKDGRCPDTDKKMESGNGMNNDASKTDGTSQ